MLMAKRYITRRFKDDVSLPAKHLAKKYSKSLSTIYRWKKAVQKQEQEKIQRFFDIDGRILGILWALGRDDGTRFVLRYREKRILEELRDFFKLQANLITAKSYTDVQYRLYITGDARKVILDRLHSLGWTERNAEVRRYPDGEIDHAKFIRAYVQIHSSLDFPRGRPRLRIYGNKSFIFTLNEVASRVFGIGLKTPQLVKGKTYCLYYQQKDEISLLLSDWEVSGAGSLRRQRSKC